MNINCLWRLCLVIALVIAGTSCKTVAYDYVESQGVGSSKWNEAIQHHGGVPFSDALKFLASDGVDVLGCRAIAPQQMTSYFDPQEDFNAVIPGVKVASVTYFYLYHGISAELAGSDVEYVSEEYERAKHLDADTPTTHRRIVTELVREHKRPHSGPWPVPSITISAMDGEVLRTPGKFERYTWCGPGDTHAPFNCQTTMIVEFNPLTGMGHILTLHGEARKFPAVFQRFYHYPYPLYSSVHHRLLYRDDKEPASCMGKATRDIYGAPPSLPPGRESAHSKAGHIIEDEMTLASVYSEHILDDAAVRAQQAREAVPYGMSLHDYHVELDRARQGQFAPKANMHQRLYWEGYGDGIHAAYCAKRCVSTEYQERMLDLVNAQNPYLRDEGRGYRDGLVREAHPPSEEGGRAQP